MTEIEIRTHFERKLSELGIVFKEYADGRYSLIKDCNTQTILVQLIISEPIKKRNSISPNGNVIQSIVNFKLYNRKGLAGICFYILAFQYYENQITDYIIIPLKELQGSNRSVDSSQSLKKPVELIFWLMPDEGLYETSSISLEGEWYFLSKGANGRMADRTSWCYSQYLNNWSIFLERLRIL